VDFCLCHFTKRFSKINGSGRSWVCFCSGSSLCSVHRALLPELGDPTYQVNRVHTNHSAVVRPGHLHCIYIFHTFESYNFVQQHVKPTCNLEGEGVCAKRPMSKTDQNLPRKGARAAQQGSMHFDSCCARRETSSHGFLQVYTTWRVLVLEIVFGCTRYMQDVNGGQFYAF